METNSGREDSLRLAVTQLWPRKAAHAYVPSSAGLVQVWDERPHRLESIAAAMQDRWRAPPAT